MRQCGVRGLGLEHCVFLRPLGLVSELWLSLCRPHSGGLLLPVGGCTQRKSQHLLDACTEGPFRRDTQNTGSGHIFGAVMTVSLHICMLGLRTLVSESLSRQRRQRHRGIHTTHPSTLKKDGALCHSCHTARALQGYRTGDVKGIYTTLVF